MKTWFRFGLALVPFSGMGAYLLWGYAWKCHEAHQTTRWPAVVARIEGVELTGGGGKRRTYHPTITYSYAVAGKSYRNDQIAPLPVVVRGERSVMEMFLRQYPQGVETTVFYSPSQPQRSVLIPGLKPEQYEIMAGLLAWVAGPLLLLALIYRLESSGGGPITRALEGRTVS